MRWQMWKGDNGLDYVDMRDYLELKEQIVAYQIAKDNLELRLATALYEECAINAEQLESMTPEQVY